ncbi:helix-turn-helix transcriptional regulator [Fodinicola acaciae]|uniref:helix-turn-helix transcriptional regulator n=1 Tax=Fodinicola acaciae TaxID=2681555 RepID=UPI0013D093C9|nr:YafY family protein [Fodinicola acaciae]
MTDTPGRLLSLLSLLQMPREWPGSELADRLGVSTRTVRRDIERLRDLGYPVRASMGTTGGYQLVAGSAMPPLLLDDEEAVAIAVGLRTAARQPVDGIEDASVRALGKLLQVLPSRLRHRVRNLGTATLSWNMDGPVIDPEVLATVAGAATASERLRFGYVAGDGTQTRRFVEPHRLVAAGHRWYLVAYDLERGDWRIFRVDRIARPQLTGVRTPPRELPATDAVAYVRDRMYGLLPTYRADVTVQLPADAVMQRFGEQFGDVTPIDEHSCRVRSAADTLEWLAFRFVQLGCEFEVHGPPELAEHLRQLGGRVLRGVGAQISGHELPQI